MIKHYTQLKQTKCNFCFQWFAITSDIKNCLYLCNKCLDKAINTTSCKVTSPCGKQLYQVLLVKNNGDICSEKLLNIQQKTKLENSINKNTQNIGNNTKYHIHTLIQDGLLPANEYQEPSDNQNKQKLLDILDEYQNKQLHSLLSSWNQVSQHIQNSTNPITDNELIKYTHFYESIVKYTKFRKQYISNLSEGKPIQQIIKENSFFKQLTYQPIRIRKQDFGLQTDTISHATIGINTKLSPLEIDNNQSKQPIHQKKLNMMGLPNKLIRQNKQNYDSKTAQMKIQQIKQAKVGNQLIQKLSSQNNLLTAQQFKKVQILDINQDQNYFNCSSVKCTPKTTKNKFKQNKHNNADMSNQNSSNSKTQQMDIKYKKPNQAKGQNKLQNYRSLLSSPYNAKVVHSFSFPLTSPKQTKFNHQRHQMQLLNIKSDKLKNKIYEHLLVKYSSAISKSHIVLLTLDIYEAAQNTNSLNKCLELISFSVKNLGQYFQDYLQILDFTGIQVFKIVKAFLTDEQFDMLIKFLAVNALKLQTIVVTGNLLTEKSLAVLCYFQNQGKLSNIKFMYMGRNHLKRSKSIKYLQQNRSRQCEQLQFYV